MEEENNFFLMVTDIKANIWMESLKEMVYIIGTMERYTKDSLRMVLDMDADNGNSDIKSIKETM